MAPFKVFQSILSIYLYVFAPVSDIPIPACVQLLNVLSGMQTLGRNWNG